MNLSKVGNITKGKLKTNGVSEFVELELSKVIPNPKQPRKSFNNIEELADSIKTHGLMQPISVRKESGIYVIISGERRFRAYQHLEYKTIKAHIVDVDDIKLQEMALIENIQREDLSDFEKAKFIGELWSSGNYAKKQDLANAIGKPASYISKAFSCLKLEPQIIEDIEENKSDIPLSVLEEISRVKDKDTQVEVFNKYVGGEIIREDIKSFKDSQKISRGKVDKFKAKINVYGSSDWESVERQIEHLKDKQSMKFKITIEEI